MEFVLGGPTFYLGETVASRQCLSSISCRIVRKAPNFFEVKCKGKIRPITGHEGTEG